MGHGLIRGLLFVNTFEELRVRSRRMEVLGYSSRSGKAKANGPKQKTKKKKKKKKKGSSKVIRN